MATLYDEFIRLLIEVNDESKSALEHRRLLDEFRGWQQGVEDTTGRRFNGDYYYLDLFDSGQMDERPMCCGVFLDWESKQEKQDEQIS